MKFQKQNGFGLLGVIIAVAVAVLMAGGELYWKELQKQKSLLRSGNDALRKADELKSKIEIKNRGIPEAPKGVVHQGNQEVITATSTKETENWKMYYNRDKIFFEMKYPPSFQVKVGVYSSIIISGGNVVPVTSEDSNNGIVTFDDNFPWGMKVTMGILRGRARDSADSIFQNSDFSRNFYGREKNIIINGHAGVTLVETDFEKYGRITYLQGTPDFTIYFVPDYIESEKYDIDEQMKIFQTILESVRFVF